jgi:hypothetical protein
VQKVGSLITGAVRTASAAQSTRAAPQAVPPLTAKDSQKDPTRGRQHSSTATQTTASLESSGGLSRSEASGFGVSPAEIVKKTADEAPRRMQKFRAPSDLLLVKSILAKALARRGLEKKVERYEFILHWKEIVGESLAIVCKPECLSRNTLVVRVINSGWAQEIGFMKPLILQRLSKYLPAGDLVDDISFRVGPL